MFYLSGFCVSVCVCVCLDQMMLRKLLDHLKLVASYQEMNKMTCQNLAVCFGPVLLSQRQEASCHTNRVFIDSEELASALHFKKHIEVLHYLLQLWPGDCDLCLFVCFRPAFSKDVLSTWRDLKKQHIYSQVVRTLVSLA